MPFVQLALQHFCLVYGLLVPVGCDSGSFVTDPQTLSGGSVAELPRAEVDFTMPTTATTVTVKASGGNYTTLQAAWNALSASGRTANTEIVIDAGYNPGPLSTGPQSGDDTYWVVIRSASSANLPRHVRVGPSDKADMPQIVVPSGGPALEVGANTKRVRFVGISTETGPSSYIYNWRTDRTASHIIFDRSLIDGAYRNGHQTRVGFGMYGDHIGVIDSYIYDINENGSESKAILVIWGSGPFGIVNNYLEASTINILFGGVSLSSTDHLPHDITFARNYSYKNPSWVSDANASVKNLFEIKHGVRFLVEHNAFENSWADAQDYAILLKSTQQGPGAGYARHITFRYNTIENFDGGINIAAQPFDYAKFPLHYVSVHDNQFTNGGRNNPYNQQPGPKAVAIFDDLAYLSFRNNDIRGDFQNGVLNEGGGKTDLVFKDNIMGVSNYGFQNAANLDTMAPRHSVTGNILEPATWNDQLPAGNCITWPPPQVGCASAGIQTPRHPSTKSGDFSNDPWGT